MIEVYNKYNKLEVSFVNSTSFNEVISRCKELKIKATKLVRKSFDKLHVYYCPSCKKRSYFEGTKELVCSFCKGPNIYFAGFKSTDKILQEECDIKNYKKDFHGNKGQFQYR